MSHDGGFNLRSKSYGIVPQLVVHKWSKPNWCCIQILAIRLQCKLNIQNVQKNEKLNLENFFFLILQNVIFKGVGVAD